jgi:regulator of replication initiation timing
MDIEYIINELIQENKSLRFELASLRAKKRFYDGLDAQMKEYQKPIQEQDFSNISPQALEALKNMRFE